MRGPEAEAHNLRCCQVFLDKSSPLLRPIFSQPAPQICLVHADRYILHSFVFEIALSLCNKDNSSNFIVINQPSPSVTREKIRTKRDVRLYDSESSFSLEHNTERERKRSPSTSFGLPGPGSEGVKKIPNLKSSPRAGK